MSWEVAQEGQAPNVRRGGKHVESFRDERNGSVGVGVQVRQDVRQDFYRIQLDNVRFLLVAG